MLLGILTYYHLSYSLIPVKPYVYQHTGVLSQLHLIICYRNLHQKIKVIDVVTYVLTGAVLPQLFTFLYISSLCSGHPPRRCRACSQDRHDILSHRHKFKQFTSQTDSCVQWSPHRKPMMSSGFAFQTTRSGK